MTWLSSNIDSGGARADPTAVQGRFGSRFLGERCASRVLDNADSRIVMGTSTHLFA
jgi:hypothetical protein